ncbi:MAG TPA: PAS domain S-box protein, partial [Gillisia sp.]|nr:PAS domain S-box protein [Gillisia sp.]
YSNVTRNEENLQKLFEENKALNKLNDVFEVANKLTQTGGWEMDLKKQTLVWTKITKDIHEVPHDFVPNLNTAINFYKEGKSRDKISKLFNLAVEKGEAFDAELQLVTAKGKEIWVRAFGNPEMEDGKCIRVYGAFQDIDKARKRDIELKLNKDKFHKIFQNSPIGIILTGPKNEILMSNPASYRIFGFEKSDEEVISKLTYKELVHPDDLEMANSYREQLLGGEIDSYKLELRYFNKEKEPIWCDVNTSIIRSEGEVTDLIVTQVEDITDRKLLEKRAEETSAQFKNAFEFSPNGMAMISLDGKWLKVNRILSKLLGYSQKEFLELDFNEITHPEDIAIDSEYLKELYHNKKKSYEIQKRYIHKNGNIVYGLISVSLLRDPEGNPLYFIVQINDISDSVVAKEALKTSLNELQTFMDATTQVAIIETDVHGMIIKFNKGAENLLGYTADEVVKKEELLHFHDSDEIEKRLQKLDLQDTKNLNEFEILTYYAMQGKFDSNEWTYTKKDGSKFPVQLVATAVTNNDGRLIGYLGIATDISRIKNIENKLSESEERLHFALEGSGDGV